jgi:ligand-binding sensor domain-containing protein
MNFKNLYLKGVAAFCVVLLSTFFLSFPCMAAELFSRKKGLPSDVALNIAIGEDNVWFASENAGVLHSDKAADEFKILSKSDSEILGKVFSVAVAFNKTWVGGERGMVVIDEDGEITELTELQLSLPQRPGVTSKAFFVKIRKMFFEDGFLWVCCYGVHGGLYRYDGKIWEEVKFGKSRFNYVTAIKATGDDIWYGTVSFGVYVYNKTTKKWTILNSGSKKAAALPDDNVSSLALFEGDIWAGTSKGVCKIEKDGEKYSVTLFDHDNTDGGLKDPNITSLAMMENGDLLVGTFDGLSRYSIGLWESLSFKDGDNNPIDFHRVYAVIADGDTVWVGSEKGILREELF